MLRYRFLPLQRRNKREILGNLLNSSLVDVPHMPNVWIRHWLQLAHNSVANVYGRSHQLTSGRSAILVCDVGRPLNSSLVKLMRVLLVAFVTTVAWRRV